MTSPVASFFATVAAGLEAATPHVDGSGLRYRRITSGRAQGGDLQHRMFTWAPALGAQWVRGHGAGMPVLRFDPRLALYVAKRNRSEWDFALDLVEEQATVWRWWLAQTESGWGSGGIQAVQLTSSSWEPGAGRLVFTFTLTSQETA